MAKISIIMGVYNLKNEHEINVTVDSILGQTFNDWELLICDDGSSNNTMEILKKVEKRDKRIKILNYEKNQGLATALNKCIEKSEGEFIARQDSDDISYPERLEKEMNFLLNNPEYDFVGCNANLYDENGVWGKYLTKEIPTKKDFLWTTQFLHPTVMFRRESLIKAKMYRVAKETKRCQDYDLFMRMYGLGMKGYNIQEVMFDYYQKDGHQKELSWKRRFEEAIIRYKGFKSMNILLIGLPYVIKPLVVKLIPHKFYRKIKKGEGGKQNEN